MFSIFNILSVAHLHWFKFWPPQVGYFISQPDGAKRRSTWTVGCHGVKFNHRPDHGEKAAMALALA